MAQGGHDVPDDAMAMAVKHRRIDRIFYVTLAVEALLAVIIGAIRLAG